MADYKRKEATFRLPLGAENEKQTRPHKLLLHQFISQEKVPYSNNADAN